MSVSNLTVRECACTADEVKVQLSLLYGTPVFVVSCDDGSSVLVCENFACPCSQRRLLSAVPTTSLTIIYKPSTNPVNQVQVEQALQVAYAKPVDLLSTTEVQLPTTVITWNPAVIFPKPPEPAPSLPTAVIAGASVGGVVVLAALVWFFSSPSAPSADVPKRTLNIKMHHV